MTIGVKRGNSIFPSNGSTDEGEGNESQKHLMEHMLKEQLYFGTKKEKQYVLRESVLKCKYGTSCT